MKYLIIFLSAFILEIGSTLYIKEVAGHNLYGMMLFSFLGPFLSLPFVGFIIESKDWKSRIYLAVTQSFGYCFGSLISYLLF